MAYQFWLDELSLLAEGTQRNYKHSLQVYLDWAGVDAEALYLWQKRVLEDGDPRTDREVARSVAHCASDLVARGYATGTAAILSSAVHSFMEANGLTFPLRSKDMPRVTQEGSRVVLLSEIRLLWDVVGNELKERNRALLMVLKDTGLRVSDVVRLTCEDYYGARVIDSNGSIFRVFKPFVTMKTGEIAYIHMGPESCTVIDLYLGERRSGPIFLNRSSRPMSDEALTMLVRRTASRLPDMDKVSAHSFRKTHRTLLEAVMPESYVKKLQGKATDPYIHPEQTGELTKAYVEKYDAIRVFRGEHEYDTMKEQLEEEREERGNLERRIRDLELRVRWEELERKHK